jgi:hypothetical protein
MIDSLGKCCDADTKKLETLIRAKGTGKKLFANSINYKEELLDISSLKQLMTTNRIQNSLVLPVTLKSKEKTYVEFYNASENYTITSKIPKAITEKETAVIGVYNLPVGFHVSLDGKRENGVDKSEGEKQVDALVDQIATVAGLFNPLGPKIANLLTPRPTNIPNFQIPLPTTADLVFTGPPSLRGERLLASSEVKIGRVELEYIPKPTSREILEDYVEKARQLYDPRLVKFILDNCSLLSLDYSTDAGFKNSVDDLVKQFNSYVWNNITRRKEINLLEANLKNDQQVIAELLKLNDRSLPPDKIKKSLTNNTSVYHSEILEPDLSEPPAVFKYTIMEKSPKEGGGDTTRAATKGVDKSGKLLLFQLSAGVGVRL